MNKIWDSLINEFQGLGGIAENICQKEGKYGRGVFSIDSNLKSRIFVPSKLMINKEDICLEGNKLRIKQNKSYSQDIKKFFNYYQDNFSWGGGGKEKVELFEKGLGLFSSNLRKLIKQYLLIDLKKRHTEDWDKVIVREFLNGRAFKFNNTEMICPMLELINHEVNSLSFIKTLYGISTPNYLPINGEITHNYNNKSSIKRFFYQGFFSRETIVFSFPFVMNLNDLNIKIHCKGEDLDNDSMKIESSGNVISIEGLPIGDYNHPNLPKDYFYELTRKINLDKIPISFLYDIFKFNILMRENILKESQLIGNEVSNMLSEILKYELSLIASYD